MIKKFEQYIKEKLEIKDDFKFSDNFQALFDMFEEDIDIMANGNYIVFKFPIPIDIKQLKIFTKNIQQFTDEIEVIFESLLAEKFKYTFKISSNNNHLTLSVKILEKLEFDYEMFEYALDKINYTYSCYIDLGAYTKQIVNFEELYKDDAKFVTFKIWSADSDTINTNLIDENILPLIENKYSIRSKDVVMEFSDGLYDEDESEFEVYIIKLKRI